jgi:cardiolipin synthase
VFSEIENLDRNVANQSRYISKFCNFPIYDNTYSNYFPVGEDMFESLKQELEEAKSFIFLEYFIIQEGVMWDSILDILERKVREGVEIRVMYDDVGCISKLPFGYNEKLKKLGIACRVFNPFIPLVSARHNNRDHRKIAIIDGNTGFCGGINLADEYINKVVRFGHWKDTAVMLKGNAVWSFTVMFLQMWQVSGGPKEEYEKYKPQPLREKPESDGYVQPYGDNPGDGETVGEQVYLNLLNKARDYVYISTPYFVVDNEILNAITLAAKDGVDVRIMLPHIPDKVYMHIVAKSYYAQLINSGVRIYEYTPGFNHSKTFVSDDKLGTVGTVNLDYRSLYLHFECGVLLYNTRSLMKVKEDFINTLQVCHEVTLEECSHVRWYMRITRSILKAFAPLM